MDGIQQVRLAFAIHSYQAVELAGEVQFGLLDVPVI